MSSSADSSAIQPLAYARTDLNRRPPLATAVGIISICIASLGLLWNCLAVNEAVDEVHSALNGPARLQQMQKAWAMRSQKLAAEMRAAASLASSFRALTPAEASSAISYIDRKLTARGNAQPLGLAQIAGLMKLLSTPGQKLIDPNVPLGSQIPGKLQMVMAWPGPNHSVYLAANHGFAWNIYGARLDANGKVTLLQNQRRPIPPPQMTPNQNPQVFHSQFVGAMISAIFFATFALLAILLLAAGVYLLRSDRRGVQLHWAYIVTKLPLSVLVAGPVMDLVFPAHGRLVFPIGTDVTLIGAIYPNALLILLTRKRFRRTGA